MKFSRANFMVPIPQAAGFDALNAMLAVRCRSRQGNHAGRHAGTVGERLVGDTAALRRLPAVPLEPCEKRAARVSSMALVRFRTNDYSVPTAYGFQDVLVKAFVEKGRDPVWRAQDRPASTVLRQGCLRRQPAARSGTD